MILICTIALIYCGYGFLKESESSDSYSLFENLQMSRDGKGFILSEKDAYTLSKRIESLRLAKWHLYLKGFFLGQAIIVISVVQIFIDKKNNINCLDEG